MRLAVKPDGENYYKYILVYVDDLPFIGHEPITAMTDISMTLTPKNYKIPPLPLIYISEQVLRKNI